MMLLSNQTAERRVLAGRGTLISDKSLSIEEIEVPGLPGKPLGAEVSRGVLGVRIESPSLFVMCKMEVVVLLLGGGCET